ncbi:hypothetical protein LCGC14_2019440 [marine sediment metagenome]|uniref:Uncharacterized protein n=1 Tax=marine sediment metagenome TaxID=412755 RepID=A0A0F9EY81_9ZZZZ
MVQPFHLQNESIDLLLNGSVVDAAIKSYEIGWTIGGVIWFWPVVMLFTLVIVMIKTDNPAVVAVIGILLTTALGTSKLVPIAHPAFFVIVAFSLVIWFFSLFLSQKTG